MPFASAFDAACRFRRRCVLPVMLMRAYYATLRARFIISERHAFTRHIRAFFRFSLFSRYAAATAARYTAFAMLTADAIRRCRLLLCRHDADDAIR